MSDTVHLLNPGTTHAEYKVTSSGHFTAFPQAGTVEPNASEELSIRFPPPTPPPPLSSLTPY